MTNELEERNKKRKARRSRRRLLSFLGFLLVLIYIPALWNWAFSANYEIGAIKTATLEIKIPLRGLLIRKENLLKSPGDGIIIPNIQYGDRVAKGNEVAAYIQTDTRDVVENYRQMETEILKRVVAEFDNTMGSEREIWESAIESQIAKLSDLSNTGDLSNANSIRSAVDSVLEAKARYMLENSTTLNNMKNEKNELERLRSSIQKSVKSIKSPVSGIVSYQIDGFEEIYTTENLQGISLEQVNEVIEAEDSVDKWLAPAEINVKKDQNFSKIVTNDEGWVIFSVPEKQGEEITVLFEKAKLEARDLSFEMELEGLVERVPIILEEVGDPKDGFQKMTSRMTKFIERTMNFRGVTGSLVIQSVTGMKVPLRSLFNENTVDNTADIAIVEMNKAKFKRVQIIGQQDSYAIIENFDPTNTEENVNTFDIYLVNPKNVVEGQVVEQ